MLKYWFAKMANIWKENSFAKKFCKKLLKKTILTDSENSMYFSRKFNLGAIVQISSQSVKICSSYATWKTRLKFWVTLFSVYNRKFVIYPCYFSIIPASYPLSFYIEIFLIFFFFFEWFGGSLSFFNLLSEWVLTKI